jgi:hypothetical protein
VTRADRERLERDLAAAKAAAIVARATAAGHERAALWHEHDDAIYSDALYDRAVDRQCWWELRAEDEEETAAEIEAQLADDETRADHAAYEREIGAWS